MLKISNLKSNQQWLYIINITHTHTKKKYLNINLYQNSDISIKMLLKDYLLLDHLVVLNVAIALYIFVFYKNCFDVVFVSYIIFFF